MAKKQTRRSISVSRATYERLKAFCETNGISMSQFVERRVGDFLGRSIEPVAAVSSVSIASAPTRPQPTAPAATVPAEPARAPVAPRAPVAQAPSPAPAIRRIEPDKPMDVDPDTRLTADQIFTF